MVDLGCWVCEDVVGLGELVKEVRCSRVVGVLVRVALPGLPSVGSRDLHTHTQHRRQAKL